LTTAFLFVKRHRKTKSAERKGALYLLEAQCSITLVPAKKRGYFACFLYHFLHPRPRPRKHPIGGIFTNDVIRHKETQLIRLLAHLHNNVNIIITPNQHGYRKIHF
jgi:hypothetical protein